MQVHSCMDIIEGNRRNSGGRRFSLGGLPEDPGSWDACRHIYSRQEEGWQTPAALAHRAQRDQRSEQVEEHRHDEAQEGKVAAPNHSLLRRRDLHAHASYSQHCCSSSSRHHTASILSWTMHLFATTRNTHLSWNVMMDEWAALGPVLLGPQRSSRAKAFLHFAQFCFFCAKLLLLEV